MKAFVFDAYGTLFDVHSVVTTCDRLFPARGTELSRLWRQKQLEYSWLRSLMGRYLDFTTVTADALGHACSALGLTLSGETRAALLAAYDRLSPYPEVPGTLARLAGSRRAILSNGTPAMIEAVVHNAGLAASFDALVSVDSLGIYKPHPSVYRHATQILGVQASDVRFVSSNYWDIAGATAFGFRTFWINRSGIQPDNLGIEPFAVLSSLDELIRYPD